MDDIVLFPAKLPYPIREGFSSRLARPLRVRKMEDGSSRSERQWGVQPLAQTLTWHLSFEQASLFEAWFRYDTDNGRRFFRVNINPTTSEVFQFTKQNYSVRYDGAYWVISATVQSLLKAPVFASNITALPEWPALLPEPDGSSYGYRRDGATRDSIEDGFQDARTRFQSLQSEVNIRLLLNAQQKVAFESFVHNDLIGALSWFKMPLASPAGTKMVRAKILTSPTITPLNAEYQASFTVSTTELPILSRLEYQYANRIVIREKVLISEQVISLSDRKTRLREAISLTERTRVRNRALEGIGLVETVNYKARYNRAIVESFQMLERVQVNASYKRTITESDLRFAERGLWKMQDYYVSHDYYADDYFGTTGTFRGE